MQEIIKKVADQVEAELQAGGMEPPTEMTTQAVKIATLALCCLSGDLLTKALAIARAVVDYEDALKINQQKGLDLLTK